MKTCLFIIAILISQAPCAQESIEAGTVIGIQGLFVPKEDDYSYERSESEFEKSGAYGLFLGYRFSANERFIRIRFQASLGELEYDLFHSTYSRGNGAYSRIYSRLKHDVMMYALQIGVESPVVQREKTRLAIFWGPEIVHHQVIASEGERGSRSFSGYYQDSTGAWTSDEPRIFDEFINSRSQESLSTLLLGVNLTFNGTFVFDSRYSFTTGIEGFLGLKSLVSNEDAGPAFKYAYRGTLGIRYSLGSE